MESAKSVLDGLEAGGHEAVCVLIDREGVWRCVDPRGAESAGDPIAVTPGRGLLGANAVFPALHGPFGEDGSVQGLLEHLDVPYVGAGVLGSALCIDKIAFKRAMAQAGMPQVRYEAFGERAWSANREGCVERAAALGFPQFVKPARLGSSVGISRVSGPQELEQALQLAFDHDPRVLSEAAASGIEVEISVIGNDEPVASEPGQVVAKGDWYDFESKYTDGGMDLVVPAPISDAQRERVRNVARNAFVESGAAGLARVDFFVTDEGQVLLNELNTIPGFTSTSVFARLFETAGIGYSELLDRLLDYAIERHRRERAFRF
ncbi:MAG: D-alanine--D-alanine ligase family protein [Phycisphaeraceae bacterium]